MSELTKYKRFGFFGIFGVVYLIAKEITKMAADVAALSAKMDQAVVTVAALQVAVDETIARKDADIAGKDAAIVSLNDQKQTLEALVKQLQDQIAAGGTGPDLQPQVDLLITIIADMQATITVLQGA